jgi:hypothetical protein
MEKRHRNPFFVTLLAFGVFLLGGGYFLQSGQALSHYALNLQIPLSVPAWYQPLGGGIWGTVWLVLAIGLWRRKEWARRLTLLIVPVQLLFWLGDWLLFSRSSIAIQSFGFDLILRLALAGLGTAILLLSGRWDTAGNAVGATVEESERENRLPHVE